MVGLEALALPELEVTPDIGLLHPLLDGYASDPKSCEFLSLSPFSLPDENNFLSWCYNRYLTHMLHHTLYRLGMENVIRYLQRSQTT
jgi:hypothetical protein